MKFIDTNGQVHELIHVVNESGRILFVGHEMVFYPFMDGNALRIRGRNQDGSVCVLTPDETIVGKGNQEHE